VRPFPAEEVPKDLDVESEEIYFTKIDQEAGLLTGYKIAKDWQPQRVW